MSPRFQAPRPAARSRGEITTTDVVVGLLLMGLIPIAVAVLLSAAGLPISGSPGIEVKEKVEIPEPPMSSQEVQELNALATQLLDESAGFYIQHWRKEANATTKIFQKRWAMNCLTWSKSHFESIRTIIAKAPPGAFPELPDLASSVESRLREIQGFMDELNK